MMMTRKINDFKVGLPKKKKNDNRPVKGGFMFEKELCTTYILGKKESGKTVLIWNILQHRTEKNTTVVIYCPTVYADKGWADIRMVRDQRYSTYNPHKYLRRTRPKYINRIS